MMMIWTFEFYGSRREIAGVIYIRAVERFCFCCPLHLPGGGGLLLFLRLREFLGFGATNAFLASSPPSHVFK